MSQDLPPETQEFIEQYPIKHRFDLELTRVHIQALGMEIDETRHGTHTTNYDLLDDGKAAVYRPPHVEDSAVVLFSNGKGYYCCHSEADIKPVDDWFRSQFQEWRDDGLVPIQTDHLDL